MLSIPLKFALIHLIGLFWSQLIIFVMICHLILWNVIEFEKIEGIVV